MNQRQQNLFKIITTSYIKTAQPVSSKLIAEAGDFDLSSATIRNEMAELENAGYIFHPHTSAGRVPTEKGYLFFVDNFLAEKPLPKKQETTLNQAIKNQKRFETIMLKDLAKTLAEFSENAVFIAFTDTDFYYTGLANLFAQPEFIEPKVIYELSQVIDHFDSVINEIFQALDEKIEIAIGRQNPFGRDCASVLAKYQAGKNYGVFGILGPMRMDYQNNFNLIRYCQELINKLN